MLDNINTYCIAPGLRSAPLIAAIPQNAKVIVHNDERGLAFFALGAAKASQKPVVIITTSGTAVGNTLPAILEAYHSNTPLILLTADRPLALYDTGANQTTDQVKCLSNYMKHSTSIALSDPAFAHTLSYAHAQAQRGPVHVNIFIDDPDQEAPKRIQTAEHKFPKDKKMLCDLPLHTIEKGYVVAGANTNTDHASALAKHLRWPLITDILSGVRHLDQIPYWEKQNLPQGDAILHLGDACVSKKRSKKDPKYYIQVSKKRFDPDHRVTHHFHCDPKDFELDIPEATHPTQFPPNIQVDIPPEPLYESSLFANLKTEHALFIGNSIPIRAANTFYFPKHHQNIYANRGLSGIDGNIATACGIVHATRKPLLAIIGDQSALHDLNSLSLMRNLPAPLQLIICNNSGGRIFDSLGYKSKNFSNPHTYTFENAAKLYGIPYEKKKAVPTEMSTAIIELKIDPELSENFMQTPQIVSAAAPPSPGSACECLIGASSSQ